MIAIAALLGRIPAWVTALACGLLAAFAHPPFGFLPGLIGYAGIFALAHHAQGPRRAFLLGWLAGAAYFTVGCWWVFEAFQVDAATFGWMAPFAVALLAGGLALFWGVVALVYRLGARAHPLSVIWFAGVFAALEWTRGHIFTGFPWNLPGETWAAGGMMSQTAALIGAYGLTWVTVFIAAAPGLVLVNGLRRSSLIVLAVAGLSGAAMLGYGALYLRAAPDHPGQLLALRIVQPNFHELASDDYTPAVYGSMLDRYLSLSTAPGQGRPRVVFWPEGALPASANETLSPGGEPERRIAAALGPDQTLVFSGFIVRGGGENAKYYNSLVATHRVGAGLATTAVYAKHRLVPFGEYTPAFLKMLGLQKLVPTPGDSASGPPPAAVDIGGLMIQPLICYESLFPGFTRQGERRTGRRAQLIVNLSNDSWFGVTSGPLQTYNLSRYRAIEEGLMMVRSTPNGVSAVIDPHGRPLKDKTLGLLKMGVVDAAVNTVQFDTAYRRFGDDAFCGLLMLSLLAFWVLRVGKPTRA